MTPDELDRQRRMCFSKKAYPSEIDAEKVGRKKPTRLYPYNCPICGLWHLTKSPR
jgi:hypothetical protein